MLFGGGKSADVYCLVSGYKLRDYGLRKSDVIHVPAPNLMKHSSALR